MKYSTRPPPDNKPERGSMFFSTIFAGVGKARGAAGAGYSSAKAKLSPKNDDEIEAAAVEF